MTRDEREANEALLGDVLYPPPPSPLLLLLPPLIQKQCSTVASTIRPRSHHHRLFPVTEWSWQLVCSVASQFLNVEVVTATPNSTRHFGDWSFFVIDGLQRKKKNLSRDKTRLFQSHNLTIKCTFKVHFVRSSPTGSVPFFVISETDLFSQSAVY